MITCDPVKNAINIEQHGIGLGQFAGMDIGTAVVTERFVKNEVRQVIAG